MLHEALGGKFAPQSRQMLRSMADFVAEHWHEPDQGIWEARGGAQHFVFGKIMCWVALDRALRMFGKDGRLEAARDAIVEAVLNRGLHARNGYLLQTFDGEGTDAALLLTPLLEFPIERRILEATIGEIQRSLRHGEFVRRFGAADGLRGHEGAFLACSFWMVDALLVCDRADEAQELFEQLLQQANDAGLYAEEIDPQSGEFLGNFPQALSHLGLIQAAVHLDLYQRQGVTALRGTLADRARRNVEATTGLHALWAAFKKSGRVGRFRSSRASMLSFGR